MDDLRGMFIVPSIALQNKKDANQSQKGKKEMLIVFPKRQLTLTQKNESCQANKRIQIKLPFA